MSEAAGAAPIRILLLEDSDIDADLLAAHLAKASLDFALTRVVSRADYVAALGRGAFDIVLADYSLPDFDGLTALDLARERVPEVPFIFVSGVVGEEFATNALKRGAADYVMKRNLARLATTVERALEQARERAARRRTEDALRRSEVNARVATDAAQLGLWEYDPRTRRLGCDARCRKQFGLPAEAEMSYELFLGGCHEADRETLGAAIREASTWRPDHDGTFAHVCRTITSDGRERWVATHGQALFDGQECTRLVGVTRDVTEERRAHEALSDLNAALERQVAERTAALADRNRALAAEIEERERVEETLRQMQRLEAVGQLTSGVAHDFNNLLMVILGSVGLIERALDRGGVGGASAVDGVREHVGHIRAAADRGATLVGQLLAFSRRQKLEPKPIDLNETVGGMRELLGSTMGGSVRIETSLAPGLWPALVDPTQIELIVLNLAINARDAMEVGGTLGVATANVTLTVEPQRPEEPAPGEYVALSVSDTGTGMTPEVLAKAFEPFFTTKPVGRGSGLGLAQVHGFAKQSGGGVRIATKLGEGTTISVYLPRSAEPAPGEGRAHPERAPDGVGGRTVLLVDDDPAVRWVTVAMLEDLGCTVLAADSGAAALEILRDGRPVDLLLADYAMPDTNGAEVAAAAQTLRPGLPVLFITGYADVEALGHVGDDRVIRKPFRAQELARRIAAVTRRSFGAP